MWAGVLFSGGKDSCLALHIAKEVYSNICLLTAISKNPYSYMFHTPNIEMTKIQAKALEMPQIVKHTSGKKDDELQDLKALISDAKEKFGIGVVVSGAIASNYQAKRIQSICNELKLKTFNPLWGMPQQKILQEVVERKFETIIIGVSAYPLDASWLGRRIDYALIKELEGLEKTYGINICGEGGEFETTVLDAPLFKKRIEITDSEKNFYKDHGKLEIKGVKLVNKKVKKIF
ncbi:MAG: diphthine--ammonia ligase [Candidatus Diapherotrites archaeon]|nr:diphthine--ammonia ligase [Candidatus Diapherotrites archaeon]